VVHALEKLTGGLFDLPEIDQNAALIQLSSPEHHFHLPVMAMQVFTLATKVSEVMSSREIAYNLYFVKPVLQNQSPPLVNDPKTFGKSNNPGSYTVFHI
jgi:hypothetical protein